MDKTLLVVLVVIAILVAVVVFFKPGCKTSDSTLSFFQECRQGWFGEKTQQPGLYLK